MTAAVIAAAKRCRQSAGKDWDDFVATLKVFADRKLEDCLAAPSGDQLLDVRGEARGVRLVHELIKTK